MASWKQQASPLVKFENSPAESFISTPGDMYPSLFAASTPPATTMNPLEILTPRSNPDEFNDLPTDSKLATETSSATEKKPVKKRKSWGQVLPEPKTNLPPRKRAKTEDEKEQRRVERVLRNRRAAQSSRERKRQEVEALELVNQELVERLRCAEKANMLLVEEIEKMRRGASVVASSSTPLDALRSKPLTLSQELFSSQDSHQAFLSANATLLNLSVPASSNPTVDPASLSPELGPVPDSKVDDELADEPEASTSSTSTDLTQRPAAMLCDLQCHQSVDLPRSWMASQANPVMAFYLQLQTLLLASSAIALVCQRPLTQIAMSLKADFSLPPTQSILKTIIWLVTRPRSSRRSSTSPSSSTTTSVETPAQTRRQSMVSPSQRTPKSVTNSPTLRIKLLQKILTCSPTLARPLQDATMEALRLVSEGCDDQVENSATLTRTTRDGDQRPPQWLDGVPLPSKEVLVTLLWALNVHQRRSQSAISVVAMRPGQSKPSTQSNVLRLVYNKRKMSSTTDKLGDGTRKRSRL